MKTASLLGTILSLLVMLCASSTPAHAEFFAPVSEKIAADVPGPLSGLWWNASEPGWGVHFVQRRNIVFATLYTYDSAGNPKWYAASNCTMPEGTTGTAGTCVGTLYEASGPPFSWTVFDPAAVKVVTAGSVQVAFQGVNDATLNYTVFGKSRTVTIARQHFNAGPLPGLDYTDLWWNPYESGWGLAITQQANVMFLAFYVYDQARKPAWYVAPSCAVSGNDCIGTLYRTTGPPSGPTFDSAMVHVFPAGTAALHFTDGDNGLLTYSVNGVGASRPITRQAFLTIPGSSSSPEPGLYVGKPDAGTACESCEVRFYIAPTSDKLVPSPLVPGCAGGTALSVKAACSAKGKMLSTWYIVCAPLAIKYGRWAASGGLDSQVTANCEGNTCKGTLREKIEGSSSSFFSAPDSCSTGDVSWTARATGVR